MTGKTGTITLVAIGVVILALLGINPTIGGIGIVTIGLILVGLEILGILKNIPGLNALSGHAERGTLILLLVVGLLLGGYLGSVALDTGSAPELSASGFDQPITASGAEQSAILKLNVKNQNGGTYAGSGVVYALHSGVVNNRNDLMKLVQEGKTGDLAPNTMTLSSGVYSYNGFNGKIGDTVTFAGYLDSTPAAAENVSFVATAQITGVTAGSTPEWMISNPQYVWYNYPTLLFYNYADTSVSQYNESESSAVEKVFTFSMYPSINGEGWNDAILWVEAPAANIAAIKQIKITPEIGTAVTYSGVPQEVTSSENIFRAVPALTTATDTVYKVGAFPQDGLLRTSSTQKGRQTIEVTYDHPASGNVLFYFKVTQNSNALTSAGGHFDSPATALQLNMTDNGSDLWKTV